ncbi:MAG TPA: glycosyltransferase family 2 protein, partial [Pirellulales bacterium]|nr:glycosyltransferase family 2 protein [Pirellulales bacterium]
HLGVGVVNWLSTLLVGPRPLPRLDFSGGIPPEHRTMVVVPTMLSRPEGVAELLEALEVRFLANRDEQLHFGMLTDFEDAAKEVMPGDEELVRLAREGVEQLNAKYEKHRPDAFFLFHRPRRWNAQEGVWMGYERKRGKLAELNSLVRGGARDRFSQVVGDTNILPEVRYVITLDTDTQLPRDSAREMVGTMGHPLNRPVLDGDRRRVVEGYGILQPRLGVSLPSAQRSWFVRLFAGDAGIDPYTRVVSDVYQDLFGEGSFVGKGIYDVDAFEQSCGGFPENAILSHDLLESAHARSGLLSDVELYEDFPSRYPVDVSRRHRWMRGDWQIAWWLLPRVPGRVAGRVENPINAVSWWKIFDNLRRSLVPIAMLALLAGGWLLGEPRLAAVITLFVLALIGAVPLLSVLTDLVHKPEGLPLAAHLRLTAASLGKQAAQCLFTLIFLPYEAYISLDAILRTLVRVFLTKRNLLEWKTASSVERGAQTGLIDFFRAMCMAPALAGAATLLAAVYRPELLTTVLPLAGLWFISPAAAWWLSRPLAPPPIRLSNRQRIFLGKLSRRTWRFFETFVTAEENWLPPDNFQEHPAPVIASRTSPTNIGLALLANLAACDFGYCSVGQLLDRTHKTVDSLARLERYRGHLYNWYDTRSLKPLRPLYVSTVDSGNLAGHLLVLRSGLLELIESELLPLRMFGGLRDTLRVLLEVARGLPRPQEAGRIPLVSA